MRSPLRIIIPRVFGLRGILISMFIFLGVSLLGRFRSSRIRKFIKSLSRVFPRWSVLALGGALFFLGRFLSRVRISLIPFRVVGFHFPILGVGLRISLWIIITCVGNQSRSLQYKKEYFGDATLSVGWVTMSIFIERISRGARAITLGARIRVNSMIGGILHRVIGERTRVWGILGLSVFEILVVVIQVYVFILLLCFYIVELE